MSERHLIAMVIGGVFITLWMIIGAVCVDTVRAEVPPPPPEQQRPDIFPVPGIENLQTLNPVTQEAKRTRQARYRLVIVAGCREGVYPEIAARAEADMKAGVQFDLIRDDSNYQFTVWVNCGLTQQRLCGGVNVFCLPYGFPDNCDVSMSDVLSDWQPGTQLGIWQHEVAGHCIQTAGEQYQLCGASCGFASTPELVDFMNTGPLSRHGFTGAGSEGLEIDRWQRIMYVLEEDPRGPQTVCGPVGCIRWGPCNRLNQRWTFDISILGSAGVWSPAGSVEDWASTIGSFTRSAPCP